MAQITLYLSLIYGANILVCNFSKLSLETSFLAHRGHFNTSRIPSYKWTSNSQARTQRASLIRSTSMNTETRLPVHQTLEITNQLCKPAKLNSKRKLQGIQLLSVNLSHQILTVRLTQRQNQRQVSPLNIDKSENFVGVM